MTMIEDRLRELRHTVGVPGLPPAEEVKQRGARHRRTRRRRMAAAGAVAVVLALLVPAVVVAARDDDPAPTEIGNPSDDPLPPGTTRLPVSGIPAQLMAYNPWNGSILVTDFEAGLRTTYADDGHTLDFKTPDDFRSDATGTTSDWGGRSTSTSGFVAAAVTRDGTLVAGVSWKPLFAFAPGQSLREPGRMIPGTARWSAFLLTESGSGLWVYTLDQDLMLIDLATGEVRQSLRPGGVRPVATVGDQVVAYDGYNEESRVRLISPDGETQVVSAPGEHGSFVSAGPDRTVWLVDRDTSRRGIQGIGDTVVVLGADGRTTEIPLPAAETGRFVSIGGQNGVSSTTTLTRDGTRLLLGLTDAAEPWSTIITRVVVVDLMAGTVRIVSDGGGAFWARDDRTAITSGGGRIVAVDTITGAATPIAGAISDDFIPIAGG